MAKKKSAATDETVKTAPRAQKTKPKKKKQRPVRNIQRHTDLEFRRAFREICTALIEKAESGGLAEIRLLLQIGQSGSAKTATSRGRRSLGEMLMDELKRRQDARESAQGQIQSEQARDEGAKDDGKAENT